MDKRGKDEQVGKYIAKPNGQNFRYLLTLTALWLLYIRRMRSLTYKSPGTARNKEIPWTMNRAYTMTNKWWENQNVLKPAIFLRGLESSSWLRRNHGWANTKAIVISRTMTIPVQPSVPFTNHQ